MPPTTTPTHFPSTGKGTSLACLPRACLLALALSIGAPATPAAQETETPTDTADSGPGLSLDELRTFTDVYNAVRKYHVDAVDEPALLDAALAGMVASLDPYSAYLDANAFQAQDAGNKGRHAGIGARLEADRRRRLVVTAVYPDGPAWHGGIRPGDLLLAVDGVKVRGRLLSESVAALDGVPGSTVVLRVRTGDDPDRSLTLERAWVSIPSVRGRLLDGNVAYLGIDRFHARTSEEFEQRLNTLNEAAHGALGGVVLDLRDNPGGLVEPAAEIADGFLDQGLVVRTVGRYPASHLEYHALPGQWAPGIPMAVLVNQGSASASEILAGALQDHQRAKVVGTRTWGKGTVQSVMKLRNGSALKLTTARYATPSGRSFDGAGIVPDVLVEKAAAGPDAPDSEARPDTDPTLRAALDLLRAGWDGPAGRGETE